MDKSPSPTSTHPRPIEEHEQSSASGTTTEHPESTDIPVDPPEQHQGSPVATTAGVNPGEVTAEHEATDSTTKPESEEQQLATSNPEHEDEQQQDKGKDRDMSNPGDYYHSRIAGGASSSISRTTTSGSGSSSSSSSNASTPRPGSEGARDTKKKDDRSGGGGSSSGSSGASGGSRSRLVAGVFVRY